MHDLIAFGSNPPFFIIRGFHISIGVSKAKKKSTVVSYSCLPSLLHLPFIFTYCK